MDNYQVFPFEFTPPDGLRNKNIFPTEPQGEEQAREQFMVLFDQLKDYINELVNVLVSQGVIS